MDNSYNIITIPEIKTPDISQGLNNAPIEWTQIYPWSNRNITDYKYWSFKINSTSWPVNYLTTGNYYTFIYTGQNWDRNKSFTELIFSGFWDVADKFWWSITKNYTSDTPLENNTSTVASQFPTRIRIKRGKIVRVSCRFETTTQSVSLSPIQWQYSLLYWSSDILSSTNDSVMFTSVSNNEVLLNLVWASSTNNGWWLVTERPRFAITIEIF